MPDSGKWLIEKDEIKHWLNEEKSKLWCFGGPGAGKTFLCSSIIDYIHGESKTVNTKERRKREQSSSNGSQGSIAWIYCQEFYKQTQTALCHSLIRQICLSEFELQPTCDIDKLKEIIRKFAQASKASTTDGCFEFLRELVEGCRECTIVIDAFDECVEVDSEGNARERLIRELIDMPIRLLVLSRKLPVLENVFTGWDSIEIQPWEPEVRRFIRWSLSEKRLSEPFVTALETYRTEHIGKGDGDLRKIIEEVLCEKYKRVFNLVGIQMDAIIRLDRWGEVLGVLKKFPEANDQGDTPNLQQQVYTQTISRIKISDHNDMGFRALQWIYAAKRPLSHDELSHAISTTDFSDRSQFLNSVPSYNRIVDYCQGLVVYLTETQKFNFFHPSVKEYLDSTKLSPNVVITEFHAGIDSMVARRCIRYLVHTPKFNPPLEKGLFLYATQHWYKHLEKESARALLGDWRPLIAEAADETDVTYKKWTNRHGEIFRRPLEIACRFKIEWLLSLLFEGNIEGLPFSLEREMLVVARYLPKEFAEKLRLCLT
ncbi:hypothetical protein Dda_4744 [Drechslerella dactyloides]|uniref:NACHT domain-containing protein n=1 Tax=Drechslerella dactyloides TaxID=74499 RepID=A0AAD6IXI7_DREDA|nr:hypothetical protein Dda_4744 [Drechslerella dactyloides]